LDESLFRPREAVLLLRAAKHLVISRFNEAGDEGRLHLGDCIIDRDVGTFVQDLATEDTHRGGRALLVNAWRVISKGSTWSEYQGLATSLRPETEVTTTPDRASIVALAATPLSRTSVD
jgi:hypothetical protein